jgi:hypothetical protein
MISGATQATGPAKGAGVDPAAPARDQFEIKSCPARGVHQGVRCTGLWAA